MDAFYAAIEVLERPELAERPLAIGGLSRRSVVATANYAARRFGIRSAMPMSIARERCPALIVLPPRFDRYKAVSSQIMAIFQDFADLVQPLSLDEAVMDLSERRFDYASPFEMGQVIKSEVQRVTGGLTVSVGISNNKFVAKVASDFEKPDGLTVVPPNRVVEFLAPLPISCLWGVGPKTAAKLNQMGFNRIDEIAAASSEQLAPLGKQGQRLKELALGIDHRRVEPPGAPKSVGWERTLSTNIRERDDLLNYLKTAATELSTRLSHRGMLATGLRLKLKTAGFNVLTRQSSLKAPTTDPGELYERAVALLNQFELNDSYRLVGLSGYDLIRADEPMQLDLPL